MIEMIVLVCLFGIEYSAFRLVCVSSRERNATVRTHRPARTRPPPGIITGVVLTAIIWLVIWWML